MTYEEALKDINDTIENKINGLNDCYPNIIDRTIYKCKEALEKQVPKKFEVFNGQDCCPTCHALFVSDETRKRLVYWEMDYCKHCGQAIDWSDKE